MTEDEILKLPYRPCVGIMLCNTQGGIFAGQRLDSAQDAWQMPQGGVEKDEDPKAAAIRELEEETGIPANELSHVGYMLTTVGATFGAAEVDFDAAERKLIVDFMKKQVDIERKG